MNGGENRRQYIIFEGQMNESINWCVITAVTITITLTGSPGRPTRPSNPGNPVGPGGPEGPGGPTDPGSPYLLKFKRGTRCQKVQLIYVI